MRYGTKAAVVMGILLPALETYRRGVATWATNFTTMFEDYLAGAVLLVGAWMVAQRRSNAVMFLLAVWGWMVGMILIATILQIESTLRAANVEPGNTRVLVAKLLLLAFSASGLVSTFRHATQSATPNGR